MSEINFNSLRTGPDSNGKFGIHGGRLLNHHGLDLMAHHDVQGGELAPAPPKRLDGPYR